MERTAKNGYIEDIELFTRTLADLVHLALECYVEVLLVLNKVIEGDDTPENLEILHSSGKRLGLELLSFVQVVKYAKNSEEITGHTQHSPAAIVDLATDLGMSYAMLLRVSDAASAAQTPISPISRGILVHYTDATKEWLLKYKGTAPEFVEKY